jgi:hypothetical protein
MLDGTSSMDLTIQPREQPNGCDVFALQLAEWLPWCAR